MKLVRVHVKGFRCLADSPDLKVGDLTALVGRNEAGKSSFLEALAVFFDTQKLDMDDVSKSSADRTVRITCEFSELPEELVIDADNPTTLQAEQLVNERGNLELVQEWDCSKRVGSPKVAARAHALRDEQAVDLLSLSISQLKKRLDECGGSKEGVNLTVSAQVRARIRESIASQERETQLVSLNSTEGKAVWQQIQRHLPSFALFKADRPSTDQDAEAQDPMRAALAEALREQEQHLARVAETVKDEVTQIAKATLSKLRDIDPQLASELQPRFAHPDWAKVFKISLTSDDEISINKRGSGVRRLILLSFFRARAEKAALSSGAPSVIFAVEEPETSQHPNNQRLLCQAFAQLAEQDGCQVLLTTHTPGLARTLPLDSLRYMAAEPGGQRVIQAGDAQAYKQLCTALGVHKDHRVRLFVGVEGANDREFLVRLGRILRAAGHDVPDLEALEEAGEVIFLVLGGDNLVHWLSTLEGLGVPEFRLYDRDAAPDAPAVKQTHIDEFNGRDRCLAIATKKREAENYISPRAIADVFDGIEVAFSDADDVPDLVAKALRDRQVDATPWSDLDEKQRKKLGSRAKARLNTACLDTMTQDDLDERSATEEVIAWFREMRRLLDLDVLT